MTLKKSTPSRGSSMCKGPEAGVCSAGIRHSKEDSVGWSGMSRLWEQ